MYNFGCYVTRTCCADSLHGESEHFNNARDAIWCVFVARVLCFLQTLKSLLVEFDVVTECVEGGSQNCCGAQVLPQLLYATSHHCVVAVVQLATFRSDVQETVYNCS